MESGLLIGGRYRLREPLGRGGMSVVWRAADEVLERDVAVKVLAPRVAADRIRDEARAAASLRHPHVVEVYDYGEAEQGPYVVMEVLDGRPLSALLTGGPLEPELAVLIGAQVAAALSAAHARGIVHRDVKPANVMVTASGAKLVDFGISAAVGVWESPHDELLGTPAYLAPERIDGGPARPATDVYALGLLLYLALAGRMPWTASTTTQMLKAHRYADPAPLPPVAGLPRGVARLVHRCLAKQPGDRPTAAELADRLGEIAGVTPNMLLRRAVTGPIAVPIAATGVVARPRRVSRGRVVAASLAAAAIAVGGFAWASGPDANAPAAEAAATSGQATTATGVAEASLTAVKQAADKQAASKLAADKLAADRAAADRAAAVKLAADRKAADQRAADLKAPHKKAADKKAAERKAAEKKAKKAAMSDDEGDDDDQGDDD